MRVAPFRIDHDDIEHELPWRLMQNGPVTLYRRTEYFQADLVELRERGFVVRYFDCRSWATEPDLHDALRVGLGMPDYTGHNFDALADSLSDIDVPEESGLFVSLDHVTEAPRSDLLLHVLARASRRWLLFGRIFGVVARTDDPNYDAPVVGAMRPMWNGREWADSARAG